MFKKASTLITVLAILTMVVPSFAQAPAAEGAARSYIVVMVGDPVVSYEGDIQGLPATRPGRGEKINPASAPVRAYVDHLEANHGRALQAAGAEARDKINEYTYALNGFSAILTEREADALRRQTDVLLVMPDELQQKETENSPDFLGLTDRAGPWAMGVEGDGVVVGVIDTGIWPEHPSFADDGSYPPPPVTIDDVPGHPGCDFGNTAQNPDDAPFDCNNKLIGAREFLDTYRAVIGFDPDEYDSARDDDGHGTHTASTAAGNGGVEASIYGISRGIVSGIAPRAHVVAYKGLGNLGGFTSDLAAAIDQAVADGVDVINYSIGGGAGAPGADEIAFLFAADAGVYVATSAGNSGPGAATLGNPGTYPWMTTVGASTQDRTFQGAAVLGNSDTYYGASITGGTGTLPLVDAEDAGDALCNPGALDPNVVSGKVVLCLRGAIARVFKSLAVDVAGGSGMILYNANDSQTQNADNHWVPSVHINNTDGLAIKSYIDSAGASATAEIMGGEATPIPAPWMAAFSSRGPNPVAGDIIKPDITAPGVNILAGASPTPDPGFFPGELFQAIAGTSMSSPHIAGAFALIKQANPDWSAAAARSALMTTAYQDVMKEDGVTPADPFDMGAGHLNIGGVFSRASAFDPGLVYDAGFNDYLGFLCDVAPQVFANPDATCAALESLGYPTDASNLNYPSIGIAELAGTETISRTVTNVTNRRARYSVSVDPPPGYDVQVSPSRLTVRPGEEVSYQVTFTNINAPVGDWRFGSLTWRSGHYSVYSPIAVRGVSIEAPYEITGTGTEGSESFSIKFGYTGAYNATGHGLEAATLTMDNVLQDPDQEFDPSDVAIGAANAHTFNLSGAAILRVALPPDSTEPDADLDVFVYDPNGDQVASSTAGGTNELVDIVLPEDGVWTVYVHGWSTPGGDSDYTMSSWVVSATPGGSLNIDSAPASATLGSTEQVDVSWSGLATGTEYLGAVAHSDASSILGLTLVSVSTE